MGDSFMCKREHACTNAYSEVTIVAKRGIQGIRHAPTRLARLLTPMLEVGWLGRIDSWIVGPELPAPERTWRRCRLLYCYVHFGLKECRNGIQNCLSYVIPPVKRMWSETDPRSILLALHVC